MWWQFTLDLLLHLLLHLHLWRSCLLHLIRLSEAENLEVTFEYLLSSGTLMISSWNGSVCKTSDLVIQVHLHKKLHFFYTSFTQFNSFN